jgi:hypothetical protein
MLQNRHFQSTQFAGIEKYAICGNLESLPVAAWTATLGKLASAPVSLPKRFPWGRVGKCPSRERYALTRVREDCHAVILPSMGYRLRLRDYRILPISG